MSLLLFGTLLFCSCSHSQVKEKNFVYYIAEPKKENISFYLKDDSGRVFNSIGRLKTWLESKNQKLIFATNGGMYRPDFSPQGFYIENKNMIVPLDTASGSGNFYLKPNGLFYITTQSEAIVCPTANFKSHQNIKFATQSGPMLLNNSRMHPAFIKNSNSRYIRNGVGILPDGKVLFAMSKEPINFYDFASFFLVKGCKNALYLDGFVSRTYYPGGNWEQTDGNFGVIIGITQ